jgi:outer membrane lipoprotein-sorting protein
MTVPHEAFRAEEVRRSVRGTLVVRILYRRTVQRVDATTIDLSCHGLRLSTREELTVGETLWVTLPALPPRQVKVVWATGNEAGCNFVEPLHAAICDAILDGRLG